MPRYTVTELAGPKVANRRIEPGETIDLSENAARAELLAGVIVPVVDEPVPAPAEDAPAAEKKTLKRG